MPGVTAVEIPAHRIAYVADDAQRRHGGERIDETRVRVRDQQHVAFIDHLKAANARAVEAYALRESILAELPGRNGEMLPEPGQVHEFQVNYLNAFLLDKLNHFLSRHTLYPHACVKFRLHAPGRESEVLELRTATSIP